MCGFIIVSAYTAYNNYYKGVENLVVEKINAKR
jgi:hypothetical protein